MDCTAAEVVPQQRLRLAVVRRADRVEQQSVGCARGAVVMQPVQQVPARDAAVDVPLQISVIEEDGCAPIEQRSRFIELIDLLEDGGLQKADDGSVMSDRCKRRKHRFGKLDRIYGPVLAPWVAKAPGRSPPCG